MATLHFKGKAFVQNYHLAVKYHQLVPNKKTSLSKKINLHDNLIIHGDNLIALKALLPTYAGKVKCIYIDPPYNTGNEGWIYNDNVNSPMMQDWLGKVVDREDLSRHDKWLCMMMPRLKLLKELLREDGGIFISIDYNEESHLRLLMDEIFGEENYRNTFVVSRVKKNIQEHEKVKAVNFGYNSILFYAKTEKCLITPPTKPQKKAERWHAFDAPGIRSTMEYEIFGEKPPKGRHWMYSKDITSNMINEGTIRQNPNTGTIQYLIPKSDFTLLDTNWTDIQEYSSNWNFPNGEKNIELIKRIIKMLDEQDIIVLDSFAGSGTTGHSILELNKESDLNRQFILIESEDHAKSIIYPRLKSVIESGLKGTFSFFELGHPIEMQTILEGKELPSYEELARYVFYTATGEEFKSSSIDLGRYYIGETNEREVYLFYKPDLSYLKTTSLNLEIAENLGEYKGKKRLVFAPMKYLDTEHLLDYKIEYCQLPFEIYNFKD